MVSTYEIRLGHLVVEANNFTEAYKAYEDSLWLAEEYNTIVTLVEIHSDGTHKVLKRFGVIAL